jgi:diguanylate cyclase (GGDEF)-like protein
MAVALHQKTNAVDETRDERLVLLNALPCAAAIIERIDGSEVIVARNEAFSAIVRAGRDAIDIAAWHQRIAEVIRTQRIDRADWRDGAIVEGRHYGVTIAPLSRDSAIISLIDRTNEVQTEKSLRSEMLHDSLTGLSNRLGFVEQMEEQFGDESYTDYAVILVDLARFSRVNECIGSLGGDELIMAVARRLMSALRGYDQVARTGANEFALVVKIVDGPGDALHVAKRIEAVMAQPYRLSDFEMKVDCAIGCALASEADGDAERLMRHAQIALKTAKGSSRVEFYQPSALAAARRHFIIETELRRTLDRDGLTMAFQPLMSLKTGRVVGFEALARWKHPIMGIISPDEFIYVAEESGLIVPLGRWALDNALKTLRAWDIAAGRKLPLSMAVNLSAIQIARDDVAKFVEAGLRQHQVDGSRLTIELTESAIIADPVRAERALAALKACNAMVAMDDFGTGFSNLASLQKLPIDTLKIDRSFITGMIGDADKVAIVRAILSLAEALGMATTAEGIETVVLADTLAGLGCTTGQGYLYAEPLSADAAFKFACESLD